MAIGTTVKVGFSATAVHAGFKKISAGFSKMTKGFAMAGRAMLAPFVKLMAVMAPILGAAGMAKGIKDVIDYGGAVSDMANRLGLAASDIVVIEEVFRRTGVAGKDIATTLQRMGKNIEQGLELPSGEAGKSLAILGITAESIKGLNMAEQFEFIGKKIGALSSASNQARVAMGLFGREGASLVNTFKTGGAFDMARKSVGELGSKMNSMADRFDKISDSLGAIGLKMRQFFAGVAEAILPTLDRMADFINGVDLTGFGEKLGGAIETVFATFRNGTFGELVWKSLQYAGAKFAEFLAGAMEYVVSKLLSALSKTELGKKLGMGSDGGSRIVTLPNGKTAIQANYRTYEDTPMNRSSVMGDGLSFEDAMATNKGAFGSTDLMAGIKGIAQAADNEKQIEWLKKMNWTMEEINRAMKQQARNTKNIGPAFP